MPPTTLTVQPGTSINLSQMGVQPGQTLVLAPAPYVNIVAHNCPPGVTIACDSGMAKVGFVDGMGSVSDLTLRNIDIVPGLEPPDVACSFVAGTGRKMQNITLDNVTATGFLKGFAFDNGGGYIKNLALINLVAARCGSMGYFINDCYGLAEGCVAYRCGGLDPNRDPTMTRGAYVNGPGMSWRRGLFAFCAMNGIRGGGAQVDNLALGCAVAFLRGDATKLVRGNVAMLGRDCVRDEPWRALVGGFEGSASFDCAVENNLAGHMRGLGTTYGFMEHGDGSSSPMQRYGAVQYRNNGVIGVDESNTAGVGYGFDEYCGDMQCGAVANWFCSQVGGKDTEIKDPSKWIMPPGAFQKRAFASMVDPTRDPQRYVRDRLGQECWSDDGAIEAIYESVREDRHKVGDCIQWLKAGVAVK